MVLILYNVLTMVLRFINKEQTQHEERTEQTRIYTTVKVIPERVHLFHSVLSVLCITKGDPCPSKVLNKIEILCQKTMPNKLKPKL